LSSGDDATDLIGLVETDEGLVVAGTVFDPQEPGAARAAIWISVDEGSTWQEVPNVQDTFGDTTDRQARAYGIVTLTDRIVVVGDLGGDAAAWIGEWTN
jgi:hypothetical protein